MRHRPDSQEDQSIVSTTPTHIRIMILRKLPLYIDFIPEGSRFRNFSPTSRRLDQTVPPLPSLFSFGTADGCEGLAMQ